MLSKNIENFIGCDREYAEARIVLFGAPFDATASYRPGSRFAGKAIRGESFALETYSPYQDLDLTEAAVFDAGELELAFGRPEPALERIEAFVSALYEDKKLPLMMGGEHLVTLGAVRAAAKKYPGLRVVHFDAHADLRDEYLGESYSHATVMRRICDLLGDKRIFQFGIRSGDREEFIWAREHVSMRKFNFGGLDEIIRQLKGKPVYFTVDLDVLDPSCLPGTGTPEAGGVSFLQLLDAALSVCALDVVGCDVCELCPALDPSGASTALAGKLMREIMLALDKNIQEENQWGKR